MTLDFGTYGICANAQAAVSRRARALLLFGDKFIYINTFCMGADMIRTEIWCTCHHEVKPHLYSIPYSCMYHKKHLCCSKPVW